MLSKVVLPLFVAWILPCCTMAQTIPDSVMTSRVHQIDTVSVRASRSSAVAKAASLSQTVGQSFRMFGVENITDALRHFSGVTVRDYGGAGGMKTVSIRGIGARHTGVVYDGLMLSDTQTGEIDLARYSLNNLSSMRLTIGDEADIFVPARQLSTSSVLHLSSWGEASSTFNSHLSIGSWGQATLGAAFKKKLSQRLTIGLNGEAGRADNQYPFVLKNGSLRTRQHRRNSQLHTGQIEGNLQWLLPSGGSLRGKVYYYQNYRHLPGIVHYYTDENDETLRDGQAFTQWMITQPLSDKWTVKAATKFNYSSTDYHNTTSGAGIGSASYRQREAYAAAAVLYQPTRELSLDYSGDFFYNDLHSSIALNGKPMRRSVLQSLSGKWQTDRWMAVVRLLSSYYNDGQGAHSLPTSQLSHSVSESHFSPSLNLSYRLFAGKDIFLRFMAKDIFRMPTFTELYFHHIGSTDLQPERTRQLNLGTTFTLRPSSAVTTNVTLDVYQAWVKDKIVAIPYNMFVWRMMNAARVRSRGLDLNVQTDWQLSQCHKLQFTGNYSLIRAENRSQRQSPNYRKQIAYTPEHTFCVGMAWHNPLCTVGLTESGTTHRWTTLSHSEGTRVGGYMETGLTLSRQWQLRRYLLTLQGTLQNLLDQQYCIVAHYPMPGRSWRVGVSVAF